MYFRATLLVSLCLLTSFGNSASADVPIWGASDTVETKTLGKAFGRTFQVERRDQNEEGELQALRVIVSWVEPNKSVRKQTIVEGSVGYWLPLEGISLSGTILSIESRPNSRYTEEGESMLVMLRFSPRAGKFVEYKKESLRPYSEARKQLESALKRGDLGMARAILDLIGPTPNGGNTNLENEYFSLFVDATLRVAKDHQRAGRRLQAAALVWSLFSNPPVDPAMALDEGLLLKVPKLKSRFAVLGFIESSPESFEQLTELAVILGQGGRLVPRSARIVASELLRELVLLAPKDQFLRLTFADGLWALGEDYRGGKAAAHYWDEARKHYQVYQALLGKKEAPARIRDRLAKVETKPALVR